MLLGVYRFAGSLHRELETCLKTPREPQNGSKYPLSLGMFMLDSVEFCEFQISKMKGAKCFPSLCFPPKYFMISDGLYASLYMVYILCTPKKRTSFSRFFFKQSKKN